MRRADSGTFSAIDACFSVPANLCRTEDGS
jgi:hypothetical protein